MNITIRQIEFKSLSGRGNTVGWIYVPNTKVKAIVQVVHGMVEHMGRYHEFMHMLAQNGYIVCGVDHAGHGRSVQDGKFGYFSEKDGWHVLLEDQRRFSKIVRSEVPDKPLVLFGHSMGSFVARLYAAKYPQDFSGMILSGTGRAGFIIDTGIQLADRSVKKHGAEYVDNSIKKLVSGSFNRKFDTTGKNQNAWLSRDAQQVKEYADDDQNQFVFTASAYRDLFIMVRNANEKKCFESVNKDMPILIFSGQLDPVGENGKGTRHVYERYIKAGVTSVEMRLYEGARHEMLHETNRAQVCKDVLEWLDSFFDAEM